MQPRVQTARNLTTSKNMALSTVRLQPGSFVRPGSFSAARTNARERRCTVTFGSANVPVTVYHGLGFAPSGYDVMAKGSAVHVYNDFPMQTTTRTIVLKCDVANAVVDILVR